MTNGPRKLKYNRAHKSDPTLDRRYKKKVSLRCFNGKDLQQPPTPARVEQTKAFPGQTQECAQIHNKTGRYV